MYVCMCGSVMGDASCSFVHTSSGGGIVALYVLPNPVLLKKICLNQMGMHGKVKVTRQGHP